MVRSVLEGAVLLIKSHQIVARFMGCKNCLPMIQGSGLNPCYPDAIADRKLLFEISGCDLNLHRERLRVD
ncbi:uncharacterized protein METZ01_LOCUS299435 [marine metagenome]|uniref:Uncharacterized protein n=1 Tax=marine metagenome TaxID=408172 RepID=A0A382MH31_9ZZZZ